MVGFLFFGSSPGKIKIVQEKYRLRINYIYAFFLFLFILLSLRIVYLQVFQKEFFQHLAQNQYYRLIPIDGKRGTILDRQERILAKGITSHSIFADPSFIKDPANTATLLAQTLNVPADALRERLSKKKRFVWVKRKVSWPEKEKIKALKIKGVGFLREQKRVYPQEILAGPLLGLVDIDNKGLDGLELAYDDYLRGKSGMVRVLQDSSSQAIIVSPTLLAPKEGFDVQLTIDAQIQYWSELYLEESIKKFAAREGSVVVVDAGSGEVLALANYPFFNPNSPAGVSAEVMRNKAVCDMFEPGSVFKVVTLIAALEEKKFKETDTFFCENGAYKIPGSILHDVHPYGMLTFREVFMKSSNIGVGKIANALGMETFCRYVKKLGFGERTGIDIPGEIKGVMKPLKNWSNTSSYMIPIGQEVGVNLVQLMMPYLAVANGGFMVKPHIVKQIDMQGTIKETPIEKRRIFSAATSERAKNILIAVVDSGTGMLARVEGVKIGGKTGTAQTYDVAAHRYSSSSYKSSFVGFISGIDRPVVIAVSISDPERAHYGGVVAAPVFKKIAEKVINYWGKEKFLGHSRPDKVPGVPQNTPARIR